MNIDDGIGERPGASAKRREGSGTDSSAEDSVHLPLQYEGQIPEKLVGPTSKRKRRRGDSSMEEMENRKSGKTSDSPDLLSKRKNHEPRGVAPTASLQATGSFVPGDHDVICGRGTIAKHHKGNKWFKRVVEYFADDYAAAKTKAQKTYIVSKIIDFVRSNSPHGGFVKNTEGNRWEVVGDRLAR